MLVGIQQVIKDPKNFWPSAEETIPNLPEGIKLVAFYPSADGRTCSGVWECDTVVHMQRFADKNWGEFAESSCYELDSDRSIGLH